MPLSISVVEASRFNFCSSVMSHQGKRVTLTLEGGGGFVSKLSLKARYAPVNIVNIMFTIPIDTKLFYMGTEHNLQKAVSSL